MPEISALLSVWNGMPYLPLTVDSVLAQTFRDFEFVVNDNGSTDGSLEYLRGVAARDPRVKIISDGENHGHSGGLNRALAECFGHWTARIDADDLCLPERFERQLAFFAENPELKAAGSLAHYINARGRRMGKTFSTLKNPADFKRYWDSNEMIGLIHPSVMYDTELIKSLGGYRQACGGANDIDLWCRIAESGGLILVQQEYLIEYRVHPSQISSRKFFGSRTEYEWTRACALARRNGQQEPMWEEYLTSINERSWIWHFNHGRKTRAKYYFRQAGMHWLCGQWVKALVEMAGAIVLQPSYALNRLVR